MKKLLSLILAVFLLVSLIPVSAFALEGDPVLTLTTNFSNSLQVGQTFTVTASLDNVAAINGMQMMLKWNSAAVKFNGFVLDGEYLVGDFWVKEDPTYNNELGSISWGKATNITNRSGTLFTANFEIIGEGALGIGLEEGDDSEGNPYFKMACVEGVLNPTIDVSGLIGLTVGGKVVGPAIPEGAPFDAITLQDGSSVIDIIDMDSVMIGDDSYGYYTAHLYKVIIPEGEEGVKVTFPISATELEFNKKDGEPVGVSGYADLFYEELCEGELILEQSEDGYSFIYFSDFEIKGEDTIITIPVKLEESDPEMGDFSFNLERPVPADENEYDFEYAVAGPEYGSSNNNNPICFFVFEYGAASEDDDAEPTYNITVVQPTGGTVTVDKDKAIEGETVSVSYGEDAGYKFKCFVVNGVEDYNLAMQQGAFTMPAKDVVISAVFERITYDVNVNTDQYGTVSADKTKAAAGDQVTLTVDPAEGYELDTLTVKQGETEIKVSNNAFTMPAGEVTVSATFKKVVAGYRFATSADGSANNGETVTVYVKITGHSDPTINYYNAYDITLTFDNTKLELATDEYNNFIYTGAVKEDGGSVTVDGNKIRIIGCGATKYFAPAEGQLKADKLATLTFNVIGEGAANVTIDKVQVSDKEESVKEDAPEATPKHEDPAPGEENKDTTPSVSVIVVPYSVSKPTFILGNEKIPHGETYTFFYTDTTNYTYSGLTVKVGGTAVETPIPDENGVYTITGVTGAIQITATQTPKSYDVAKPENVVGPNKATYGEDYIFTVTPDTGYEIDEVEATIGDKNVDVTLNTEGKYVIDGENITGSITITVTQKEIVVPETKYTNITFSGITVEEIVGGLTQKPEAGKDFTFTLNTVEGYNYVVKIGDDILPANEDGTYTIPAAQMIEGNLAVTIEKTEIINVEVAKYVQLNGKSIWLVTAKSAVADSQSVLKYGESVMYTSNKYGTYCWLVISSDSVEAVKTAAEVAVTIAETGTNAPTVAYDCDVNGTSKVDVNDAQLVYDMYNAAYEEFNDKLTVEKFLEADMDGSKYLDTKDVAAIISYIVSGANA